MQNNEDITRKNISQTVSGFTIEILWYLFNSIFSSNNPITSPFNRCQDSSAVMTCAKLWPDLIIIRHVKATLNFTKFGLWAHKPLLKRVPEISLHDLWQLLSRTSQRLSRLTRLICCYGLPMFPVNRLDPNKQSPERYHISFLISNDGSSCVRVLSL